MVFVMKSLVLLLPLGVMSAVTWGYRVDRPGEPGEARLGCSGSSTARTTQSLAKIAYQPVSDAPNRRKAGPIYVSPACAVCALTPTVLTLTETYIEDMTADCSGYPWARDQKWKRDVNIRNCSDGRQYRFCGPWVTDGCWNGGQVGSPPACGTLDGRAPCTP